MIKYLKLIVKLLRSILLGANVVSILLMLLCGLTSYFHPDGVLVHSAIFSLAFPFFVFINLAFLFLSLIFYIRYVWVPFIGLILGFGMIRTYCPFNIPNPHPKGCIKVMSYNVAGFSLDTYRQKKDSNCVDLLNYLKQSGADVLCLQEYNFTKGKSVDKIEETMGHWRYFDTVQLGGTNVLALCSNYRILRKEKIPTGFDGHGSAAFYLEVDKDTIVIINNHLVSNVISADDKKVYKDMVMTPDSVNIKSNLLYFSEKIGQAAQKRALQSDSIVYYIKGVKHPVIVCGDLNDSPMSYVHRNLTKDLQDAYVASGQGPGISYHESGMFFRLDNILCSKDWVSYDAGVDNTIAASDHYPIFVYLKLNKSK